MTWCEERCALVPSVCLGHDASLVAIDNCGHLPMIENPEICNEQVLRFLNEEVAADDNAERT